MEAWQWLLAIFISPITTNSLPRKTPRVLEYVAIPEFRTKIALKKTKL